MPKQSDRELENSIQKDSATDRKTFDGSSQIDVARLANVSQAAVSRTFTQGASVSEETREKVMAAAKELGYRPNVIARSLIRKSTNIIGLVVMRFMNPFYSRMIRDFTRALQEQNYWTLLLNIAQNQELEKTLPMALQYQVDGLIITSTTLSSSLALAGDPLIWRKWSRMMKNPSGRMPRLFRTVLPLRSEKLYSIRSVSVKNSPSGNQVSKSKEGHFSTASSTAIRKSTTAMSWAN